MTWQPLQRFDNDPDFIPNPRIKEMREKFGIDLGDDEVWLNDDFQVTVRYMEPTSDDLPMGREGMMHLSIHRRDRHRIRDWRIMQQIKNEVAGEEREAVELFPKECEHTKILDSDHARKLGFLPADMDTNDGLGG